MTRLCKNCGFENQDEYDFCAKCGTALVEGLEPRQIYVCAPQELEVNKKALIAAYITTIFLSWSGAVFGLFYKNTIFSTFTFFGFFMPFFLVQSRHPALRKHGLILMAISLAGVSLSFYIMMN
ncbi:zinc ribbon domain-containing protein [Methanobrevibacter sp.]|uniref:zinc ribbon domain-containing protein n=1 Tax=Methanobrevibacter sp. TaxID=66852 RepID=UPI0026DFB856|nr:zinc ribbon domain-containing protein [Methanobrevibacter sp.]MDO5824334.1 zinc ribbon domain-containing protein [Methanobrevibacter sp.]